MSLVDCTKREHNDQNVEIKRINELTEAANGHHHQSFIEDSAISSAAPLKVSNGHRPPSICNGYGMELASLDRIQRKNGIYNVLYMLLSIIRRIMFHIVY